LLNLSSFYKLKLKKTKFIKCALQEVDFTEADLSGAVLDECDLQKAVFDNTILEKADLRNSYHFSIDPNVTGSRKRNFLLGALWDCWINMIWKWIELLSHTKAQRRGL
jgi:fluoroquinolone resistance protein